MFGSFFNFLTMHVSFPNLWCFDHLFFPWSLLLLNCLQQGWRFLLFHLSKVSPKLLCLSLKRIWRIYSSYCLQRRKYSCALWDFIDHQAWRIQPSYFSPIWDGTNLGDDVTSFYLFCVVLIYPFATLWSFGKWGHNKGDACNIKHQHSIVIKVVAIIEIGIAL